MSKWSDFLYLRTTRILFIGIFIALGFFLISDTADAAYINTYSDTITDSAPAEYSNHKLDFIITTPIPAGGYIRFVLDPGDFTIPATNFDIDNVELFVNTGSGYVLRVASSTADATYDGVVITTGTSGNIQVNLNSTAGIPTGAQIRMLIGTDTTNSTTTDVGILNPSATSTFTYNIEIGGGNSESVRGFVVIVDNISVGPVDTTETIPPLRFNGAPSGTISGTSLFVEISVETDEFASCRYETASGTPYFSMGNQFNQTFSTIHSIEITVATSTSYSFFVRCIDDEGNFNIDDYVISFSVPAYPVGTPGASGTDEGVGSGTGEGSGSANPGGGAPNGTNNTSGGTSGGGSGGGGGTGVGSSSGGSGGSGGFEGVARPYQSGDGRVIINGYAFPNSTVIVIVDGAKVKGSTANSTGKFSVTVDSIASGAYTFGVYAVDDNNVKSTTFSTTFTVTGSRGSTLSNINIMPSILVSPDPVDPGTIVNFTGYSIPNATINIENQSDKSGVTLKNFTTTSDSTGEWSFDVDTTGFNIGTYKVRAKSKQDGGVSTNYSDFTYYGVGEQATLPQTSDLNRDGSVNLIDFSILLYWWNSAGGASDPPADINGDGRVSLTDFSIMIFNWTG